jgi:diguanylate cyclase (GGDEF)-like protein
VSLRRQVVASWAIAVVVFGILVVLASSFFLVRNLASLEENHSRDDLRRIRNAVSAEITNLDSVARDYASWDQTYAFVANPTPEFIKSELTDSTFRTIRVNALLLLDNKGNVLAIKTLDQDGDQHSIRASDLLRMRTLAKNLVGPVSIDSGVTGITRTSQGAFLFAVRPILTTEHKGPSRGTLIMARAFNGDLAHRISTLLDLPVTIVSPETDIGASHFQDDTSIERINSTTLTGTVVLRGAESEPALVLKTEVPVVIQARARRAQWYLVAILLVISTAMGFAKLAWLERRVLLPIADLSKTIKQVTEHDDLTKRTPIRSGGRNELAMLIVRVNLMLDRLQRSRQELLEARSSLEHQATHDGLTGALNQSAIRLLMDQELARASRESRPVAALMIDIDHFKSVNDTYGHETGDEVLKAVVREIRKVLRPYDSLGRYGGEEFLIMAPNADNDCAMMIAERIRKQVCDIPMAAGRHLVRVTVSIGVSSGIGLDLVTLIRAADQALYASKDAGRNKSSLAPLHRPQPRLMTQGVN